MDKNTGREKAYLLVKAQGLAVILAALIAFVLGDVKTSYSALLGGLICVVPTWYLAFKSFAYFGARQAHRIVWAFYKAEAMKLVLTVVFFVLAFKYVALEPLPFFVTFIVAQLVFWFAPLLFRLKAS